MRSGKLFLFSRSEAVTVKPGVGGSGGSSGVGDAQSVTGSETRDTSNLSWLSRRGLGMKRGTATTVTGDNSSTCLAVPVCQAPFFKVSTVTGAPGLVLCAGLCFRGFGRTQELSCAELMFGLK